VTAESAAPARRTHCGQPMIVQATNVVRRGVVSRTQMSLVCVQCGAVLHISTGG
jgi:hypothetical protein